MSSTAAPFSISFPPPCEWTVKETCNLLWTKSLCWYQVKVANKLQTHYSRQRCHQLHTNRDCKDIILLNASRISLIQFIFHLWKLLKAWVRTAASVAFEAVSTKILEIVPPDFLWYLQEYWLPVKYLVMWLVVYCKGRTVYELSNTNMIIEVWVLNTCLCCPKAFYRFPTGGTMYSRESFLRVVVTVAWTI